MTEDFGKEKTEEQHVDAGMIVTPPDWGVHERRRMALFVLERAEIRIEARRRAEWRRRAQERIDEKGCGAVMVLLRMAREDWL